MNWKLVFLSFVLFAAGAAHAADVLWPSLPTKGFVSGRAATKEDMASGNAVFVAQVGDVVIGKPINIKIPQYAFFKSEGKRIPVIVVQAEEAQGIKMIGARLLDGSETVGLASDFELLGTAKPK